MTSILIVEDHEHMVSVLTRLLQQKGHMDVVGAAKSAEQALAMLPDLEVDLVLIDISLPGMNGIDLVSEIKKVYPRLRCLMLSGHQALHYVKHSLNAGANGYVSKQDTDSIIDGINSVLAGNTYLSKEVASLLNRSQ
jgi:DNA-binding NarL/FixJ family response regulator